MFGHVGVLIRGHLRDARACQGLFFSQRLTQESVRTACDQLQHESRERVNSPALTLWVFLTQVLSADHSCRAAVAKLNFWRLARELAPCSPDTNTYCETRQRLPEALFAGLVRSTGRDVMNQADEAWHWCGRVVKVIDGSTITMPDTRENQREYPQSRAQAERVGLPIARVVVVFSLAVGVVVDMAIGTCQGKQSGENNLFRRLLDALLAGEVALADRHYASFWDFALLLERGVDLVARAHHLRKIDFRQGLKLGYYDHIVEYRKPTKRPYWMDSSTYDNLPPCIHIRQLRYQVVQPGFRTRTFTLATTLLDAELFSAEELANLYRRRWDAETYLAQLKTIMGMDVLRCKTISGVLKEMTVYALVYNLVRLAMIKAASEQNISVHVVSFIDALRWLAQSCFGPSPLPWPSILDGQTAMSRAYANDGRNNTS